MGTLHAKITFVNLLRDRSIFVPGGGEQRENGWVNKMLWVEMGGLNKNSSQLRGG
jgi:hypothetical protein